VNNLHETTELKEALEALPTVEAVNYEFPGFWDIKLTNGLVFALGDLNGFWAWHDLHGIVNGETEETEAPAIAKAFSEFLAGVAK
jgi:hypothetical protein